MTTQDHNKKTLRQFQCRDYLWEIFEQMGAELECSTDYLVNEAMRQYARSRNWGSRGNSRQSQPGNAPIASAGSSPGSMPRTTSPAMSASSVTASVATSPQKAAGAGMAPAAQGRTGSATSPVAAARAPAASTTNSGSLPPPLPSATSGGARVGTHPGGLPSLFVIFNGQKVPVNKEEFVIGRGSKTADLPIKDGNISRRHAAIVFQNGGFFMKDLGSTNGIEFNGERVDVKRIEEGDIFQLCDYELRFTYR